MAALVFAGESAFLLPFVVARVFRTTFLDVFGLSNLQLGGAFSLYGVIAMASYFCGGPLADRYSARGLIALALLATAVGGALFATVPALPTLTLLYGFWGLTTILLFWAALIRATREWGGADEQGRAYGILDGGRGLLAAIMATAAVAVFAQLLPSDAATASAPQRAAALRWIILVATATTALSGVFAWFALPPRPAPTPARDAPTWAGMRVAARLPGVWLQALVIVCAYVAYKVTDNFGLYAHQVLGFDEVAAARLGALTFWTRPFAAFGFGLIADRAGGSRTLAAGFALLALGALVLGSDLAALQEPALLVAIVATTCVGIYGVRALYHAVMNEARVPLAVTGSAAGLASVIGYTPDVFAGALTGWLLDRDPGAAGHRHVFLMVAGFAIVGLLAALALRRLGRGQPGQPAEL